MALSTNLPLKKSYISTEFILTNIYLVKIIINYYLFIYSHHQMNHVAVVDYFAIGLDPYNLNLFV